MRFSVVSFTVLFPAAAHAADLTGNPTNYETQVASLGPGDTLYLDPGDYEDCLLISGMHGTAANPITIEGPEPYGGGAIFRGTNCTGADATIFIEDSSYIEIRNLEIDVEGIQANGLRFGYGTTPVHHATVEFLYIHGNGVTNQYSGISAFCTTWDVVIRANRIENAGLGMYLGDSDGGDPFIRGTVEQNLILNPRGYGAQIKHQFPRINVAGMPTGDSVSVVRHNVFIKAMNAGVGGDERPNLLIGDLPQSGVGANDRYEVYGNFFFQNQTDVEPLLQIEGNVSVHDNVMVNSYSGTGIVVRPHNGSVRDIGIFHNTLVTDGVGVSITGGQGGTSQQVVANAIYSNGTPALSGGDQADNVVGTLSEAAQVLNDPTPVLGQLDVFPQDDTVLRGAAVDLSAFAGWTDVDVDFNGDVRDGTYRGAYAGSGMNPGWELAAEVRTPDVPNPPVDGGVIDGGADMDGGVLFDTGATPNVDASQPGVDASQPGVDSGAGGTPRMREEEGCGCATTEPRSSGRDLTLVLFGALLFRRRPARRSS